ncbi:hypothetical protein GCWU000324_00114 [Kingella oralis ATCC 51147]|jgi:hypothetical protein|uniref:Uncharacterized protein n=2 Tax=Kingella TaxID=32257 RepID=C4GEM7_9NEIS|nr:hypothetical protein GCWU000324_00114 [Kingella oralis ATCC 51147]
MHVLASLKPSSLVFRLPQTSPKAKTMPRLKITRFAAQAECHYQATQQGNARTANRAYAQIVRAKDSLVAGGHLAALVPLLCHEHAAVRLWAARYLLFCPPFAQQTEAVLTTIAAHGAGILIADAKQTLTQWRKGNLTLGD